MSTLYEIWIKNDPSRTDGFVGDTQCTIRSRDGESEMTIGMR